MKTIQDFIDQQLGFAKWRSYDNALLRLRCLESEEYKQIWLEDDTAPPVDSPIFACKFAHKKGYEHILALANEDGKLAIHDTSNRENRFGKQVHHNAIFDLAWMSNVMKLVTVSGDHTARLVSVSNADLRVEHMFSGHTRSVKTIAIKHDDSSVFATGSRDGSILVWDIRSSLSCDFVSAPDRIIYNAHFAKTSVTPTSKRKLPTSINPYLSGANSVTGLVFQDENTLVSCSAGDGTIKVWDLRKSYKNNKEPCPKNVLSYSGNTSRCGFSNLIFDKDCIKLYANCLDHNIYCYNMSTYNSNPVMKYVGHQNNTFYVKSSLSNDGLYLLSGSSDQNAYIWHTSHSEPVVKLKGHNAEVTCVAWCQNADPTIVTCSDDMRHKIWRIGLEVLPDNWEVIGRGNAEFCATKRRHDDDETFEEAKKLKTCLPFSGTKRLRDNSFDNASKKLCLTPDPETNHHKRILNEADEIYPKKMKIDHEGTSTDINLESQSTTIDLKADGKFRSSAEVLSDISSTIDIKTNIESSPRKVQINRSPVKTPKSKRDNQVTHSPTTNLPNFVVDGNAPHLNYSPEKRADRDWLTKLRVEKSLIREMQELASGSSPSKVAKLNNSSSNSPRSRSLKKQYKTSRCGSPQNPLLKFFRVTNNSIMKDSQCVSKANLNQLH